MDASKFWVRDFSTEKDSGYNFFSSVLHLCEKVYSGGMALLSVRFATSLARCLPVTIPQVILLFTVHLFTLLDRLVGLNNRK